MCDVYFGYIICNSKNLIQLKKMFSDGTYSPIALLSDVGWGVGKSPRFLSFSETTKFQKMHSHIRVYVKNMCA